MDTTQEKHQHRLEGNSQRSRGLFQYALQDHVALLTMYNGDNLINPEFIRSFLKVLDVIEKQDDAHALVVRSANPKVFSLGIDIDWALKMLSQDEKGFLREFFLNLDRLFMRILLYPMPTLAAVNGHVFGIGVVFSCCFDIRYMRLERGYLCLPEVDLNIPLLPGMVEILRRVIPTSKLEQIQYTGGRLTPQECVEAGFASRALPGEILLEESIACVKGLNKKRSTMAEMKMRMHRGIVKTIQDEDPQYIAKGETIYA